MPKVWKIEGRRGLEPIFEAEMPGNITDAEMRAVLQRLVCTNLSPRQVVYASLRRNDAKRSHDLDPIGKPHELHYGQNPWYTARLVDKQSSRPKDYHPHPW